MRRRRSALIQSKQSAVDVDVRSGNSSTWQLPSPAKAKWKSSSRNEFCRDEFSTIRTDWDALRSGKETGVSTSRVCPSRIYKQVAYMW
ncbi:hypothetical protein FOPE_10923 [Fonsecaea pedrosoi]|nr:hypothetical protein FOPE_10923 [Fonsecaea pedrosoi]